MLRRSATDVLGVTAGSLAFAGPPPDGDPRYRVVPNGIDVGRFAGARKPRAEPGRAPMLTYIGRSAPEKNRGFLLRVHAEAKKLREGTRLTIVGPGGIRDLEAVDPAVGTDPSVHLAGENDHVDEVLADSDVLLLTSHREGLPGVVLEALAAGVPVLASDLPGLRDLTKQVEGLTLLSLGAGPVAWARTALELAALTTSDRDRISKSMSESPFTLESAAAVWRKLWTDRC
jgi:glycosyltransferase involved in cell wall biosynthesis